MLRDAIILNYEADILDPKRDTDCHDYQTGYNVAGGPYGRNGRGTCAGFDISSKALARQDVFREEEKSLLQGGPRRR